MKNILLISSLLVATAAPAMAIENNNVKANPLYPEDLASEMKTICDTDPNRFKFEYNMAIKK